MPDDEAEMPKKRSTFIVVVPVLVFAALAIVFGFSLKSSDPSRLPSALIGKPVPTVTFAPLEGLVWDGKSIAGVTPAELSKGQVTVVNFWASWCVPCVQEHPLLMGLARQGVRVAGVNYKDPVPGGRRFIGRYGNPYELVGMDPTGRGAIEWGVYGMPETFVVDGKGHVVYKHVGPLTADVVTSTLLPEIKRAAR